MSSTSSKSSKNRRNSILKVRQTTVDTAVDVAEQQKNRRRVSFHHQKTVKEYDKEKHELSATSPLKEALREAMSDFDSTKSNSTFMSLGTPDRTTGENNTMMMFRGMMSGGQPSSIHHETKDMSFSIIEDPANPNDQNDTLNVFNGLHGGHMSIHSKTVDISYKMEESVNESPADDTMDVFRNPANQSTRTTSNMTMDMDISKMNNTLTDGGLEGDDTMDVFSTGSKKKYTTIPLDNTMDVFGTASGSGEKSAMSQSILMDMSANPTPVSSQDGTMAVFGQRSQSDESVAMDEATMIDEIEEEKKMETPSPKSTPTSLSLNISKHLDENQSPSHEDTMAVFGTGKSHETGDEDVPMEMSMAVQPVSPPYSPTMNMFKRKGDDDIEESENMDVSGSKKSKENGDSQDKIEVTMKESAEGSQEKSAFMDEIDETMNVFGVKISTMTAVEEITEKSVIIRSEDDRTMNVFNRETSQMDLTGSGNDVINSGGDSSRMDLSGVANETIGIFGKKDEKEEEGDEETFGEVKNKEEEKISFVIRSIVKDNSIHDEKDANGSADMEDITPIPSQSPLYNADRRKTRLSTVIEVSSGYTGYTAASSQSMRQRVESTDEDSKGEGILDRMDDSVKEKEEINSMEIDGDKSVRMEELSMVSSPSATDNNTTFSNSLTKRNMLDETRLSDRSMMNITRTFDEIILEKIDWMRKESEEDGEIGEILREKAYPFIEGMNQSIQRSESTVDGLLSKVTQMERGDLLYKSIMKLNATKVADYRLLFEWARREAQREWWEKRGEIGDHINGEMERRMKKDEEELTKAKDDFFMMNKLKELRDDVESMRKEVEMGRGLSRNTIDELIGSSKKKEEEKERLKKEINKMEMENVKQSTIALKIMAERCHDIDQSIKTKMAEREKNKRYMRSYISQLTNNLN